MHRTRVVVLPEMRNAESRGVERVLTGLSAVLGVLPVAALLAWVYGLGPFATWFWVLGGPAMLALAAIGLWLARSDRESRLRTALICGAVGGLIGTVGYDAIRIPQVLIGLRPYIPIESYGLLALNAPVSSDRTELFGWAYNFSNGIGFGISYGVVALGRRWYWAIVWAFLLETATVVSPFATMYQLAGKWDLIALAYIAHLAYGYPLGKIVQAGDRFVKALYTLIPHALPAMLVALGIVLTLWHWPFGAGAGPATMAGATTPSTTIIAGQFSPYWVRVPAGGCATVYNSDSSAYTVREAIGMPTIAPGQVLQLCFDGAGVVRARTSGRPDAGGIVLVDPAMSR